MVYMVYGTGNDNSSVLCSFSLSTEYFVEYVAISDYMAKKTSL